MKLIRFCLMKRKGDNTMHSVNDDSLDDLVEGDSEDLILEDFRDLEIEREWISIYEIYLDEFFEDDSDEDDEIFIIV